MPTKPTNATSAMLTLGIPGSALVREFVVTVQADPTGSTTLGGAGTVRIEDSSATPSIIVVDFGMPLTVSSVEVPDGATYGLQTIWRWQGDSFNTEHPVWSVSSSTGKKATFAEVTTERLRIEVSAKLDLVAAKDLKIQLPALPADLEIHVNGGPAVWRYSGKVTDGVDGWVKGTGTDATTHKDVSITDAVAALLGDPDKPPMKLLVELRARVPGRLGLLRAAGTTWDILRRVPLPSDGELTFDAEGVQELAFSGVPDGKTLKEVRVKVVGNPPKERAVPAVGPERLSQAELVLDSGRSACVRFPGESLMELTALRLPLHAQGGDAEVRAQLLASVPVEGADDEPGAPLEGSSATRPATLAPAAANDASDGWTLLPFDGPVAIQGAVWVSLRVTRGKVRWSLGHAGAAYPVRRGPATGPWVPLPEAVTGMDVGAGEAVSGRLHAIGHAPKEHPLAPLQLQVAYPLSGAQPLRLPRGRRRLAKLPAAPSVPVDVNSTARGAAVALDVTGEPLAKDVRLRVISRSAGVLTLKDLIAVVSE